jgi:phosphate transport system substrate-binding protein
MNKILLSTAAVAVVFAGSAFAQSRDQIRIVGSSTVFPYTQAVAEQFAGMTAWQHRWSSRPAPAAE